MTPLEAAELTRKTISFDHGEHTFYLREPSFIQLESYSALAEDERSDVEKLAGLIKELWVTADGQPVDASVDAISKLPARFVVAVSEKLNELTNIDRRLEEAAKN